MSQYQVEVFHQDRPVRILMGFDRHGYFMVIEAVTPNHPGVNENDYLYTNLDDKELPFPGLSKDLEHFKKHLKRLGINVPPEFLEKVEKDRR